jgi:hypothetical protein
MKPQKEDFSVTKLFKNNLSLLRDSIFFEVHSNTLKALHSKQFTLKVSYRMHINQIA